MKFVFEEYMHSMPLWLLILFCFLTAFIISYISIPAIVKVSKGLNLYEKTKKRGSHIGSIPTLGGIAIFAGVVISGAIFLPDSIMEQYRYVLAALVILFFTGVKDDLLVLDPKKKFIIQLLVSFIVILLGDIRITSFHGFLGIEDIPYLVSVPFTAFVFIVVTNGFNLIDGIDGLASGIAILVTLAFGTLFIVAGEYEYAFEPIILAGSLIAFFIFNVFSKENKIFLGDTGSLTIGFIISVIAINFLECDRIEVASHPVVSVPALTIGILIVPLFDTLRVFVLRIFGGESPFHADRKHIHHRLLDLGFSHLKSSLIIIGVNLLIVGVAFLLRDLRGSLVVIILSVIAAGLSYVPVYLVDRGGVDSC
jgi:UDP-GlcNAc:undecaprenyl-phosphate GlcNAc-1-phosphate transferase